MTKKLKLSPWHDGNVKPVHIGVYERNWYKLDRFYNSGPYYAFWDGGKWMESRISISDALSLESIGHPSHNQEKLKWRGILK